MHYLFIFPTYLFYWYALSELFPSLPPWTEGWSHALQLRVCFIWSSFYHLIAPVSCYCSFYQLFKASSPANLNLRQLLSHIPLKSFKIIAGKLHLSQVFHLDFTGSLPLCFPLKYLTMLFAFSSLSSASIAQTLLNVSFTKPASISP